MSGEISQTSWKRPCRLINEAGLDVFVPRTDVIMAYSYAY